MAGSVVSDRALTAAAVVAMLVLGTTVILLKDTQAKMGFYQPYLWAVFTFAFQPFCLPVRYCMGNRDESSQTKPPATLPVYALVTSFRFVAIVFVNIAYLGLPGSMLQMLKGMKVIFTTLLTLTVLRKSIRSYQYLGVSMVVFGVVIVGAVSEVGSGTGWGSPRTTMLSILAMVLSTFLGALGFVAEEKVMNQYATEPLLMTGMEGIFGTLFGILLVCCVQVFHIADIKGAFSQLEHSHSLLSIFVIFAVIITFDQLSSLAVTRYTSALMRTLLEIVRTAGVWLVEIYFSWDRFSLPEALGFVIVVLGVLVYSKHVVVPCLPYEEEQSLLPVKESKS